MFRRNADRGWVGISAGLITALSIALIIAASPIRAKAQSPSGGEPPLTDRERALIERVQNLESELSALRDVQARLAAIEARLGADAPQPPTNTSRASVAVQNGPQEAPDGPASDASTAPPPLPSAGTPTPNGPQGTGQSPATKPLKPDDSTALREASDGNPGMFGEFNPGRGFVVGRGPSGELDLSGYMVARYLNQVPADQHATDHLGRPIPVDPRNDFQFHRVMLFAQGWLFSPKFRYQTFVWTVQDTNQVAVG